jgi:hypothetical protein
MTDDQAGDVHALTRSAGITPATTRLGPGHPLLKQLAPGQRFFVAPPPANPTARNAADPNHRKAPAPSRGRTGRGTAARRKTVTSTYTSSARTGSLPSAGKRGGASTAAAPQTGAAAFSARSRVGARHGGR